LRANERKDAQKLFEETAKGEERQFAEAFEVEESRTGWSPTGSGSTGEAASIAWLEGTSREACFADPDPPLRHHPELQLPF
jgi:hypothetical protein